MPIAGRGNIRECVLNAVSFPAMIYGCFSPHSVLNISSGLIALASGVALVGWSHMYERQYGESRHTKIAKNVYRAVAIGAAVTAFVAHAEHMTGNHNAPRGTAPHVDYFKNGTALSKHAGYRLMLRARLPKGISLGV